MEEQRIFAYSELIQELLKCPQGEEGALLVKNAALVDMGLIITMQVTAKKMKETGYENDAVWLHYLADQVAQIDARQFITEAIQKIVQAREAGLEEEVDISIESWRQERTLADVVSTDIYSWMRNHEARINQYSFNAIPVIFEDLKNQYPLLIIASLFNDLGICLCYAFKELETRKIGVDAAIIAYECALSIHTKEVPELWAEGISNLANAYLERIQGNKEDNIQKAIEYLEQISIVCTRDTLPVLWAGIQNNLAGAYYRLQPFVGLEVLKQVIHYYELSLEIYEQEDCLSECLSTSRALGDVNVEYDQWEEAIKAYQKALDAAEKIYQESFLIEGEAAALKFFSDLPRRAAYAYAKTGQNSLAVITIENACARKLSKVWQLNRAVVQDASASSSDYQNIKQKIQELEHQQRSDQLSHTERNSSRELRESAQELHEQFRKVCKSKNLLRSVSLRDVQNAINSRSCVVYLITLPVGSLALIVTSRNVEEVWIHDFTGQKFQELTIGLDKVDWTSWVGAYHSGDKDAWNTTIKTVTGQLWEPLMSPLIDRLKQTGNTRATLIPTGYLSLLPLHAAWTKDTTKPTGKRYALDEIHFTYAPNAQSLIAARAIADRHTNPDSILAIDNPLGDLRYSTREVNSAIAHFTHDEVLPYDRATVANVAAQLGDAAVVHFSCHGSAITTEPLNSHLQLHTTEIDNAEALEAAQLKLVKIFELNLSARGGIRLAILSACETGLTGIELADEAIGLPTGLMQAGVAGVIASLWKVDDLSTSLLMQKFYDLWRKDKLEPSEALRRAQIWLRDSTNAEKNKEGAGLRRVQPNTQDFKHPFHWAAFSYLGI